MNSRATIDSRPLNICLDARLETGRYGGVEQVIIGLAHGLSRLQGEDSYTFLAWSDSVAWLEAHVSGPCSILTVERFGRQSNWRSAARRVPFARSLVRAARRRLPRRIVVPAVPESDGLVEDRAFDLIHFTKQDAFLTEIPSIYHPHDLQHLHYPEFFRPEEIAIREISYRAFCEAAAIVSVTSRWNKRDLVERYGLPEEKVAIVHLAPALSAYEQFANQPASDGNVLAHHSLPERFLYYPAQTWRHKNHERLLEALSLIRRQGEEIPLVCSGTLNEYFGQIQRRVEELGLQDLVRFLGYVPQSEVVALYDACVAVVMPTLFEAAGGFGPISEAFLSGKPVACSRVTSIPDEVDGDALLFDPFDPEDIASTLDRLWHDEALRQELSARGKRNVARFSWDRTARTFRAHYRRICQRDLSLEDGELLAAPPLF